MPYQDQLLKQQNAHLQALRRQMANSGVVPAVFGNGIQTFTGAFGVGPTANVTASAGGYQPYPNPYGSPYMNPMPAPLKPTPPKPKPKPRPFVNFVLWLLAALVAFAWSERNRHVESR